MADEERDDEQPKQSGGPTGSAGQPTRPAPQPPPKKRPEEQIGRTLGRLFGRLKRTGTWQRSEQAYHDAVEGKDEQEPPRR